MQLLHGLVATLAYGALGIVLMIAGLLLFDRVLKKVDVQKELAEKHNIAVAIVTAAIILGIAWVIVHAIGS